MIQLGGARLKCVERSILTTKKEETKSRKEFFLKQQKTTNECTTCTLISAIIRYEYIVLLMCD